MLKIKNNRCFFSFFSANSRQKWLLKFDRFEFAFTHLCSFILVFFCIACFQNSFNSDCWTICSSIGVHKMRNLSRLPVLVIWNSKEITRLDFIVCCKIKYYSLTFKKTYHNRGTRWSLNYSRTRLYTEFIGRCYLYLWDN